jgi:hypothetical protein
MVVDQAETVGHVVSEITRLSTRRDRFLTVGRLLRQFYDELPQDVSKFRLLERICDEAGIGTRTAMHWMDIDRAFAPLHIPREWLASIGWAKLSLITRYVREDRRLDWLTLAESHSLSDLKVLIRGGKGQSRSMLLTFPVSDYALIVKALAAHGAIVSGGNKQLLHKEEAFLRICRIALSDLNGHESLAAT